MQTHTNGARSSRKNSQKPPVDAAPESAHTLNVTTGDGIRLFVQKWDGSTKAAKDSVGRVLVIVHGIGEHGGRYQHLAAAQNLGDQFDAIYAFDQRGHGRSTGLRGYAPSFDVLVDDALLVAAAVQEREPGKALFLLGHSMGGLVSLRLLLNHKKTPFKGAVIVAPFLALALAVPAWKRGLGRVLAKSLSKVQLDNEINPSHLSHDPAVVEGYVNDRLVHSKCTPRFYVDLMAMTEVVTADEGPLACPALFLVPGQDMLVKSEATLTFFKNLKDRHKTLKQYPSMFHEVLNEIDKSVAFADIKAWLKESGV